jgi:hypothetical protein
MEGSDRKGRFHLVTPDEPYGRGQVRAVRAFSVRSGPEVDESRWPGPHAFALSAKGSEHASTTFRRRHTKAPVIIRGFNAATGPCSRNNSQKITQPAALSRLPRQQHHARRHKRSGDPAAASTRSCRKIFAATAFRRGIIPSIFREPLQSFASGFEHRYFTPGKAFYFPL